LDGWLGELGRKNLLLLAASLAKLAELGEFGEFGDFGDWKLKIENNFSLSKPATTTKKKINFLFLFLNFFHVRMDRFTHPRGRGFYRVGGW
jgi:hypothetical protein